MQAASALAAAVIEARVGERSRMEAVAESLVLQLGDAEMELEAARSARRTREAKFAQMQAAMNEMAQLRLQFTVGGQGRWRPSRNSSLHCTAWSIQD